MAVAHWRSIARLPLALAIFVAFPGPLTAQPLLAPSMRPDHVEFSNDSRVIYVSVMWDRTSSGTTPQRVGFASDDALEIEVRLAERCYLVPRGGRDIISDLDDANVWHNFPRDIAESAYVDPWNYYVPPNGLEASEQLANYCPAVVALGALAIQTFVDLDADTEANFTVGIRRPDLLVRGRWYRIGYPVGRSDSSFIPGCPRSVPSSRARIRFEVIPNTCTYFGVRTDCPFVIGFPRCGEFASNPREHFVFWSRICTPTGPIALESSDAPDDRSDDGGGCSDGDDDGWFAASASGPVMYGSRAGDCGDDDASIHPGAEDLCDNLVDEDCDGLDTSCSSSCAGSASGSSPIWTCAVDRLSRQRCVADEVQTEICADGCIRQVDGTDDYCGASSCVASEIGACTDGLDNDCDSNYDCGDSDCRATPACAGACLPGGVHQRCWIECVVTYPADCTPVDNPPLFVGHKSCRLDGTWGVCAIAAGPATCDLYTRTCVVGDLRPTSNECGNGTTVDGSMECRMPSGAACTAAFYADWAVHDCSDFCSAPDDLCTREGDTRPCEVHCGGPDGPVRVGSESCSQYGCGLLRWGSCQTGRACAR